jgi:L-asparaginase II
MRHAPVGVPTHVPLVHLIRDGFVEGVHHGSVVVLAPDGSVVFRGGDVGTAFFPRSTAKPMQAVAMTRLGLSLPPDLLALAAASHSGEPFHLDAAQRILDGCGCTEDDLGNPADRPFDPFEATDWIASGRPACRLAHNCSGKHAAMLALCRTNGWRSEGYRLEGHRVQRLMHAVHAEAAGVDEDEIPTGVDGCGVVTFALPLERMALAFQQLESLDGGERVASAMRTFPELIRGAGATDTRLMQELRGWIAKGGAEGLLCAAGGGVGIALKAEDGNSRGLGPAAASFLSRLDVAVPALEREQIRNSRGETVGEILAE